MPCFEQDIKLLKNISQSFFWQLPPSHLSSNLLSLVQQHSFCSQITNKSTNNSSSNGFENPNNVIKMSRNPDLTQLNLK